VSLTITTDVFCDGDDCSQWTFGVSGPRSDAKAARTNAKHAGWSITRRGDFCPECAKQERIYQEAMK
jgi:hypothetical protein